MEEIQLAEAAEALHVQINNEPEVEIMKKRLYEAALAGDWESVEKSIETFRNAFDLPVNRFGRTALHVAAGAGHSDFVKEIVKHMSNAALKLPDTRNGNTALHFASLNAGIEAVIVMVETARRTDPTDLPVNQWQPITQIRNKMGWTPLLLCAAYITNDRKDVLQYLSTETIQDDRQFPIFSGNLGAQLVCNITAAGLYDVAIHLITDHPELATAKDNKNCSLLDVLARKSSDFPSGSQLGFWRRLIYSSPGIKQYLRNSANNLASDLLDSVCSRIPDRKKPTFFANSSILRNGAKFGIVELVTKCIQTFPDQIWLDDTAKSIFHTAVKYRKGKIFSIMYGMSSKKRLMACWRVESGNHILHLAAILPPLDVLNVVAGAALQMQRELQWFKEVEKVVQPTYMEFENEKGETPTDVFVREHKDLMEKGEKWMKDTASSCMVVAILITTVVFAAAFTVPGGNYQDNDKKGYPILLHSKPFMVFVVSDVMAFFSSVMSVLMFLSILTSRYAMEDFLELLPKRLILGLSSLFFSIAAMMVAFSATLCLVLNQKLAWAFLPIGLVASFPVSLYVLLQFPLLVEMIHSTYWPDLFHGDTELQPGTHY